MLVLDNDYVSLYPALRDLTARMKIDFSRNELNAKGYGDVLVYGLDGLYGGEIKAQGEMLGDIDHMIAQVKSQMAATDFMHLFLYGETTMAPDGNSYSLKIEREDETWNNHPDSGMVRRYRRRHHRVNYQAQRKILWRFRNEGIHVVECRDLTELAYELCLWHETATTVGTTFTRLNVEKFRIGPYTEEKTNFMLSIMGLMPRWGGAEEVAEAVATWMEGRESLTIDGLIGALEHDDTLAAQPLRNSLKDGARKRTIGPAAVEKLRKALGLKE